MVSWIWGRGEELEKRKEQTKEILVLEEQYKYDNKVKTYVFYNE